jgi:hypothetical protein
MVADNLATESGSGSGVVIGGAGGREGGQQDDAAFGSSENALPFELRPSQ